MLTVTVSENARIAEMMLRGRKKQELDGPPNARAQLLSGVLLNGCGDRI
jgi:hypothetical protein